MFRLENKIKEKSKTWLQGKKKKEVLIRGFFCMTSETFGEILETLLPPAVSNKNQEHVWFPYYCLKYCKYNRNLLIWKIRCEAEAEI